MKLINKKTIGLCALTAFGMTTLAAGSADALRLNPDQAHKYRAKHQKRMLKNKQRQLNLSFHRADRNRDGALTRREIKRSPAMSLRLLGTTDFNKDRVVSKREFVSHGMYVFKVSKLGLRAVHPKYRLSRLGAHPAAPKRYDTTLERKKRQLKRKKVQLNHSFSRYLDKNKDGILTKADFAIKRTVRYKWQRKWVRTSRGWKRVWKRVPVTRTSMSTVGAKLMRTADFNRDQVVTRTEYVAYHMYRFKLKLGVKAISPHRHLSARPMHPRSPKRYRVAAGPSFWSYFNVNYRFSM